MTNSGLRSTQWFGATGRAGMGHRSWMRSQGFTPEVFDGRPVIGIATIQAMRSAGALALSIDAGRTLVLEGEQVFASSNEAAIAIVGRPPVESRAI